MKGSKDLFSKQAKIYKHYRPKYPQELYEEILRVTEKRDTCWDCGTGNGQVAIELSKHFKKVYATDISERQINYAEPKENINYLCERAEKTSFTNNQFDLITVAQAVHWFDFDEFNKEATRVLKEGGIISIWGYGLLRIEQSIDRLIDKLYKELRGSYWDPERRHIENEYESVKFDFEEIKIKKELLMEVSWTKEELTGYLNSWSSVQNYISIKGENPVSLIMKEIEKSWKDNNKKQVVFPVFMKVGRNVKQNTALNKE